MNLQSAQRILVCLRYGIGDVVMQTPALEALRRACLSARITALGARPAIELLERDPRVDKLICTQGWGLSHWGDSGTPEIKRAIRQWIAQQGFDVILDPYHAVIAVRDVLWQQRTTILDTGKEAQDAALKYQGGGVAAMHAATLEAWGLASVGEPRPRLYLRAAERRFAARFFFDHDLNSGSTIAISPVASTMLKRWPIKHLAAAADRVIETYRCKLLALTSPQFDNAGELLDKSRHAERIVVAGNLHLRRVAAVLSRCAALIGNDTGLMHVAAAVGVPVVAVFGPTASLIYRPSGTTAVSAQVACRHRKTAAFGPPDCVVANRCLIANQSCIDQVDAGQVVRAVEAILGAKYRPDPRSRQFDAASRSAARVGFTSG